MGRCLSVQTPIYLHSLNLVLYIADLRFAISRCGPLSSAPLCGLWLALFSIYSESTVQVVLPLELVLLRLDQALPHKESLVVIEGLICGSHFGFFRVNTHVKLTLLPGRQEFLNLYLLRTIFDEWIEGYPFLVGT